MRLGLRCAIDATDKKSWREGDQKDYSPVVGVANLRISCPLQSEHPLGRNVAPSAARSMACTGNYDARRAPTGKAGGGLVDIRWRLPSYHPRTEI